MYAESPIYLNRIQHAIIPDGNFVIFSSHCLQLRSVLADSWFVRSWINWKANCQVGKIWIFCYWIEFFQILSRIVFWKWLGVVLHFHHRSIISGLLSKYGDVTMALSIDLVDEFRNVWSVLDVCFKEQKITLLFEPAQSFRWLGSSFLEVILWNHWRFEQCFQTEKASS